jgi:hypothetical protein
MNTIRLIPIALILLAAPLRAGDDHKDHKKGEKHEEPRPKAGAKAEAEHADHEEGEGEEHGEEANPNVGPGKGVEAFGREGIKLSAKAAASMKLKTEALSGAGPFRVPIQSLVSFQDDVGIYRSRGGWLKLAHIEVVEKSKRDALVKSRELKAGDAIVVSGVAALRVVELDLTSGEVGHGH